MLNAQVFFVLFYVCFVLDKLQSLLLLLNPFVICNSLNIRLICTLCLKLRVLSCEMWN